MKDLKALSLSSGTQEECVSTGSSKLNNWARKIIKDIQTEKKEVNLPLQILWSYMQKILSITLHKKKADWTNKWTLQSNIKSQHLKISSFTTLTMNNLRKILQAILYTSSIKNN